MNVNEVTTYDGGIIQNWTKVGSNSFELTKSGIGVFATFPCKMTVSFDTSEKGGETSSKVYLTIEKLGGSGEDQAETVSASLWVSYPQYGTDSSVLLWLLEQLAEVALPGQLMDTGAVRKDLFRKIFVSADR